MPIKYYIDYDYWTLDYKSPNVKKLEACSKEGLTFDFLVQQASQTIFDYLNVSITDVDQWPEKIQHAIKYSTAMLIDHYLANGTNFSQINTSNTTGDVSEAVNWLTGFDPSILPTVIVSKLTNEGLYYTLTDQQDIIDFTEETITFDTEVISTSTRPNLISKTQKDINEQFDTKITANTTQVEENRLDILEKVNTEQYDAEQNVQDTQIEANTANIATKVSQTQYDTEQTAQDVLIQQNENRSENNSELIKDLAVAITAGGSASEIFKSNADQTVIEGTPLANNADIKIESTRPDKLSFTQETGYKTFDVYDNGTFAVALNGDITSATNSPIQVVFELVDNVDNVVVDSTTKTFDFTSQSSYANQVATLHYSIIDIDTVTITERRFYLRTTVLTVGASITILKDANIDVSLAMTGGVASIATTDDVVNTSNAIGGTATEAFNSLKTATDTNTADVMTLQNEKVNALYEGIVDFSQGNDGFINGGIGSSQIAVGPGNFTSRDFERYLDTTEITIIGSINEINAKADANTTKLDEIYNQIEVD